MRAAKILQENQTPSHILYRIAWSLLYLPFIVSKWCLGTQLRLLL